MTFETRSAEKRGIRIVTNFQSSFSESTFETKLAKMRMARSGQSFNPRFLSMIFETQTHIWPFGTIHAFQSSFSEYDF